MATLSECLCEYANSAKTVLVRGYQLCEVVMPGWTTSLPQFFTVFNPDGDNSVVCTDFTANPGETVIFEVDNTRPPGGLARTIGFWKNWSSCSSSQGHQDPVLDQTLAAVGGILIGDLNVTTCEVAVDILDKRKVRDEDVVKDGKKKASDPAFNLAAQLFAAQLNVAAGAGACAEAVQAINDAQALLDTINFNGNKHLDMTPAQKTLANSLAATLDSYNNNTLCL